LRGERSQIEGEARNVRDAVADRQIEGRNLEEIVNIEKGLKKRQEEY
jgi:hypothetical protein